MSKPITITLAKDKECKGSIRFATDDAKAAVSNVYVARTVPGIESAKTIKVTLEVAS